MKAARTTKLATPGAKYGRWTALMQLGRMVHAICECGTKREVYVYNLVAGKTLSCGCWHKEVMAETKGTERTEDEKQRVSEAQKQRWQDGYYDVEKTTERAREIGKAHGGQPQTGRSAKGPENAHAKEWSLRSPQGVVISGKSLPNIVRENAHMFDARDVQWVKNAHGSDIYCLADRGLSKLFLSGDNRRNSWKGWTKA